MNDQPDTRAANSLPSSAVGEKSPRLRHWFLPLVAGWTILIAALAGWSFYQEYLATLAIVRSAARDAFNKDLLYRRWASAYGGVYVPITDQTPPNPYLAGVPERDITTPSGKKLTLMNPAYMTRQAHELAETQSGVRGHITSIKPLRPKNVADDWEKKALLAFERGEKEVSSLELMGKDRYLRLMRPLVAEQGCLKCHASQGYKLGDIRGGISVSVPWAPARDTLLGQLPVLLAAYGTIWAIGILGLYGFRTRLQRHLSNLKRSEEALRKQETFTRVMLENQSDGIVACDADMKLVVFNRTAREWHGVDVRDLPPEQWSDYYTLYDAEGTAPLSSEAIPLVRAFCGEHVEQAGMAIRAKNRETRYITASGDAFFDDSGRKLGAVAIMRDITALKKAEVALRESEEKHRLILDNSSDLIWCLNPEGVFTYVSSSWKRVTGYEPSSILDTSFPSIIHPDDVAACLMQLSRVIETKEITQSQEYRVRHADGSWHWHVAAGTPVLEPGGEVVSVVGVSRDVTERKQAEEELRDSKQQLDIAIEGAGMGAWHWDIVEDKRCFSDQACSLLGINTATFRGTADEFFAVMPPEDREAVKAALSRALDRDVPYESDYRTTWSDGSVHWITTRGKLFRDKAGRPLRLSGVVWDVTARKRAEEELLHAKAELQQYATILESSNRALEEFNHLAEAATRAKSQFLANMSHEIRTPMTAILGYADLMLDENIGRGTREHVEVIKRNGEHLLGLINDILDLSKVEAGKIQIEPVRCSPRELAADVVVLMRVRAAAKHLKLETELAGPLPETVLTDPLRLRQVLVNLVGNAIKFTDRGEVRITVRLTSDGGPPRLRFDVTDSGIGMNETQIGGLFQAFSQADNSSTRKFGGTGLGLCISKRLTEALGGNIEVRSEPGMGSTFSVIIDPGPLDGIRLLREVPEPKIQPSPLATLPAAEIGELHGRILLAEDGLDNQRLICLLLRKAGADVVAVENGQLAVEAALAAREAGQPFRVILMDMQMPVMDGYVAARRLRARGYTGPIIALTAHAMAEDCQKCLDAGCDNWATKPIDRQKLLATVAPWVARAQTHCDLPKCATSESNATSAAPTASV
jgi:PAS domain S-box-containing protein